MTHKGTKTKFDYWLNKMPVVAILRGIRPEEVVAIGCAIHAAGVGIIEVPLNSPQPFASIKNLSDALGDECVIGCGTLVNKTDAKRVAEAGAKIAVTPNVNPAIIKKCIKLGMLPAPGWATPSEAFAAYKAGAKILKMFPAATYGAGHAKAVAAVLPDDVTMLAVGGVGANNAAEWLAAGIDGFGIGSEIYTPGLNAEEVSERTQIIVNSINLAKQNLRNI